MASTREKVHQAFARFINQYTNEISVNEKSLKVAA
jgi:hypothetical protein